MFAVESYAAVRRFVFVEGHSQREAAKVFGLSRETIAKMCRFSLPPGYTRSKPVAKPKLGLLLPVIDRILAEDYVAPVKQRHTAKRIFERLRDEHGYGGGYTVVKDYVRQSRAQPRDLRAAGASARARTGGLWRSGGRDRRRAAEGAFLLHGPSAIRCLLCEGLSRRDDGSLPGRACLRVRLLWRVPLSILYDNTKIAVAKICGDGKRERTQAFTGLVSHHLFADRFGRPGKGNDKGKVEGLVKYARSHFMVPIPRAATYDDFNAELERRCRARQEERAGRHTETIGERLAADLAALRPLPAGTFEPCETKGARVSSTALVRYRTNDYSVPTSYGFQDVVVKGFVDRVVILCGGEEIARHPRCYGEAMFVANPLHYLALIETKPGALDQAAALQDWNLPEDFQHLRHLLEVRMGNKGSASSSSAAPA
jgi:transposase